MLKIVASSEEKTFPRGSGAASAVAVVCTLVLVLLGVPVHSVAESDTTLTRKYAAYAYCDAQTEAAVEIANNSKWVRTARLTALLFGREAVDLGTLDIGPYEKAAIQVCHSVRNHSSAIHPRQGHRSPRAPLTPGHPAEPGTSAVAERLPAGYWGDGSRPDSVWFGLVLDDVSDLRQGVDGDVRDLLAWAITTNEAASLRVDTVFFGAHKGSSVLESQWFLPTAGANAFFVVQNVSRLATTVTPRLWVDGETYQASAVPLAAGQSSLLSLRTLLGQAGSPRLPEAGLVSFEAHGSSARLVGRAMLAAEPLGFSAALWMHDGNYGRAFAGELQSVATLVGAPPAPYSYPDGLRFKPFLIMTNTSDKPVEAIVALQGPHDTGTWIRGEDQFGRMQERQSWVDFALPAITLAPHETQTVDVVGAFVEQGLPYPEGQVGLKVNHTGSPSTLRADVVGVDETLNYSYFDKLVPTDEGRTVHTAIAFDLTQGTSLFLLKNRRADRGMNYHYVLHYMTPGGDFGEYYGVGYLAGGESKVISLLDLRDQGLPDNRGETMPMDVTHGFARIKTDSSGLVLDPTVTTMGTWNACLDPCCEGLDCIPPPLTSAADKSTLGPMTEAMSIKCDPPPLPCPPADCSTQTLTTQGSNVRTLHRWFGQYCGDNSRLIVARCLSDYTDVCGQQKTHSNFLISYCESQGCPNGCVCGSQTVSYTARFCTQTCNGVTTSWWECF